MSTRGLPKDVKGSGYEGGNSLLFSAEIKNQWKYASTLPQALMAYTMTVNLLL